MESLESFPINGELLERNSKNLEEDVFPDFFQRLVEEKSLVETKMNLQNRVIKILCLPNHRNAYGYFSFMAGTTLSFSSFFVAGDENESLGIDLKKVIPLSVTGFFVALFGVSRILHSWSFDETYHTLNERKEALELLSIKLREAAPFFKEWESFDEEPTEEKIPRLIETFKRSFQAINTAFHPFNLLFLVLLESIRKRLPEATLSKEFSAMIHAPLTDKHIFNESHPFWAKFSTKAPSLRIWKVFIDCYGEEILDINKVVRDPFQKIVDEILDDSKPYEKV